ncbi:sugar ABC transporter substrate-binding protein [Labrys wisconsinensis]|uniref:ABC-type sugar transport system substrate-binding protein n=1 Tax=Labrys wisconsinensis TaxID=425677 RepID=A0ABU0JM00_9HYPH|nr:sugar ABC transporter substrate-binding protein [Labrys wisconsinensis]MDQ0475298.1 ABC-type sugar transport system substrate-binding protein [Labrys wisconsinensis]
MPRPLDPRRFPDFSDKRVVNSHMDRLDTHGVSRRDFLALASAGAAASAAAMAMGLPSVAVAAPSGKLAFLTAFYRNEYNIILDKAFAEATADLGFGGYVALDGNFDSQLQLNQFEQQTAAGIQSAIFNLADGSPLRRIAKGAQDNQVYVGNVWDTLAWFTPFEAGDYYTLHAVPEEFAAHRAVTVELLKAVTERFGGGDIIGVTGQPGNWTDIARSGGRDDAFKDFPKTRLVDQLPGKWNREDSLKATEDLLSRHKNVVGVVAQNDDVAQGVIAALNAAGLRPGEDVLVVGADGTSLGAKSIDKGTQLATSANSPAYAAALFAARIYDVTHGWQPRAPERLLNWRSLTATKANISGYLARFVDNKGVKPFDYRKLSKVLHPSDWDPQADVYPIDIDKHWAGIPKPDGWTYPKEYTAARANGEFERVKAEYADHYKIKFEGPSPNA